MIRFKIRMNGMYIKKPRIHRVLICGEIEQMVKRGTVEWEVAG